MLLHPEIAQTPRQIDLQVGLRYAPLPKEVLELLDCRKRHQLIVDVHFESQPIFFHRNRGLAQWLCQAVTATGLDA